MDDESTLKLQSRCGGSATWLRLPFQDAYAALSEAIKAQADLSDDHRLQSLAVLELTKEWLRTNPNSEHRHRRIRDHCVRLLKAWGMGGRAQMLADRLMAEHDMESVYIGINVQPRAIYQTVTSYVRP